MTKSVRTKTSSLFSATTSQRLPTRVTTWNTKKTKRILESHTPPLRLLIMEALTSITRSLRPPLSNRSTSRAQWLRRRLISTFPVFQRLIVWVFFHVVAGRICVFRELKLGQFESDMQLITFRVISFIKNLKQYHFHF